MNKSTRNQLDVSHMMDSERTAIDTLYEIADAELAADKTIHDIWARLANNHTEFRKLFAKALHPHVQSIGGREQMYASWHMCNIIAQQIATDWWLEYKQ